MYNVCARSSIVYCVKRSDERRATSSAAAEAARYRNKRDLYILGYNIRAIGYEERVCVYAGESLQKCMEKRKNEKKKKLKRSDGIIYF